MAYFDTFVEQWYRQGGKELLEHIQTEYDSAGDTQEP